jgi:hypothetical protein
MPTSSMDPIDTFRSSPSAPTDKGAAIEALWWLMKGDWKKAHECVQAHEGEPDCDSVHAHLHRQEGDLNNAGYWYRRAGRPVSKQSLDEEWTLLATELLSRS